MIKKIMSVFLTLLILAIVPLSISAETSVQPRYSYIMSHSTSLVIKDDIANCEGYVDGDTYVTSVKMTLTLQKKVLWWWDDIIEWSDITPNSTLSMSESTSVGSGTYRVKMWARVCAGSAADEEIECYSGEKTN